MLTHGCGWQVRRVSLRAFVGGAVLVCLAGSGPLAGAQTGGALARGDARIGRLAHAASGSIEGLVLDEAGQPLTGATVSALGLTTAASVTDVRGRFALKLLPAGSYIVRAYLSGFVPSRRQLVDVRPNGYARFTFSLQREMIRAASLGPDPALVKAALGAGPAGGFPGVDRSAVPPPPDNPANDDHSETAWRLRHLPRSVLRDATMPVAPADAAAVPPAAPGSGLALPGFGQGAATRNSSGFFNLLPINGEVNLLMMGAVNESMAVMSPQSLMNGVAYVSLHGPAATHGDWSAKIVMAQADITSWFFSGAYHSRAPGQHVFDAGASYGLLRNALNAAGNTEGFWSRSAGTVYGVDRWTVTPYLTLTYGGSFSSYDYLPGVGYLSPRATVTVSPTRGLRLQSTVARSVVAPGSDDFMQPMSENLWVPAPKSFVAISGTTPEPVERVQHYEVSVERDLSPRYVVAFRTFYQQVADQQAVLFASASMAGEPYLMASAGDLNTRGWSVGFTNAITNRLRGSVWYGLTESTWTAPHEGGDVAVVALPAGREVGTERLHDVTTQLETEIPGAATRVFVIYRINTGFARHVADTARQGFDTRFDLQVTQPLPFLGFSSAQWQVLFAVRNLFREGTAESSVYDELLVVRPPKRIVGGLIVRF